MNVQGAAIGLRDEAEVVQRRTIHPLNALDHQPYLTAAGINLPLPGDALTEPWTHYDGSGVQFIDVEQGWDVSHQAFNEPVRDQDPGVFSIDAASHGNAVLGIVMANGASSRIRGIAPGCTLKGLYAPRGDVPWQEGLEVAIRLAAESLGAGDVLLIPLQIHDTLLPVEVEVGVFRAIRYAVSKGIIVIEAAGNQRIPLEDELRDTPGRMPAWTDIDDVPRFHGFPDSGAIIVGGCVARKNAGRYDKPKQGRDTRVGARVDCCAWSQSVWTSFGMASKYGYFSHTSASSPIIAGLALLVQQCAKEHLGRPLSAAEMRELFRDPACGTAVDPIDPAYPINMPDACKLFKKLEQAPN